jgi:hypothetical protein
MPEVFEGLRVATMPVYGYQRRIVGQEYGLLEMREVTFQMAPTELRRVAAFLVEYADRIDRGDWKSDHAHMKDAPDGIEIVVSNRQ